MNVFKLRDNSQKGMTLLELMVACSIFTLLIIILFSISRYSLRNWKSIEDRVAIQSEIRKIQTSLVSDLEKSSFSSVVVNQNDYRHAVTFTTYMDPDSEKFSPQIQSDGTFTGNGYVLFVLVRPIEDPCIHGDSSSADNICPHKMLLRVDLTRNNDYAEGGSSSWDPISLTNATDVAKYIPISKKLSDHHVSVDSYKSVITGDPKYIKRVQIVARDILSFDVTKATPPDTPRVKIVVRIFNIRQASETMKIGLYDIDSHPLTTEIKNFVIPLNP